MLGQLWEWLDPELPLGAAAVWLAVVLDVVAAFGVVAALDDVDELAALASAAPPPTTAPVMASVTSARGIRRRIYSPPFLVRCGDMAPTIAGSDTRGVGHG
jgi:hypothetical protein